MLKQIILLSIATLGYVVVQGGGTDFSCGDNAKGFVDCRPLPHDNGDAICIVDGPGVNNQRCGVSCHEGFAQSADQKSCIPNGLHNSPNDCGKVNPKKCTTPFDFSFATCIPQNGDFVCGASCRAFYSWDPTSQTCRPSSCPSGQILTCAPPQKARY